MSAAPGCDKILLVQAELDGELDAAQAAALAAHRAGCPICQEAAKVLTKARGLIGDGLYQTMPADLRDRVMAQLTAAQPHRGTADSPAAGSLPLPRSPERDTRAARGWALPWWARWWSSPASFGLGAASAAAIALLVLAPRAPDLAEQIVSGHIRALQPGHLEDVVSTDRHTVKPWFDGRIDFAPPVKDLAAQRFPLRGGRLDYVGGRPVAALVYQRDRHIINLFTWPTEGGPGLPEAAQRQGYNVVRWTAGGMALWAVSDIEATQLREFAEAWQRSP